MESTVAMLRRVESRDVEAILEIQEASPNVAQWTAWDYQRVARGELAGWVADDDGRVLGFLIARQVAGDMEILNLAVHPGFRRRGTGSALLAAALEWSRAFRAENALLEVRAANQTALEFYEKHGFRPTGRRKGYYTAPADDALVLSAKLSYL